MGAVLQGGGGGERQTHQGRQHGHGQGLRLRQLRDGGERPAGGQTEPARGGGEEDQSLQGSQETEAWNCEAERDRRQQTEILERVEEERIQSEQEERET